MKVVQPIQLVEGAEVERLQIVLGLVLVVLVIQLKLPTDSIAKEYTYKVDASIHEEPFSGKFHWDSTEKDGADIECSFSRGSRGYAHMESVSGNGLNVIYRLPISF